MLDFLTTIVDFFGAIGSFLMNIVEGLAFVIMMIPKAMSTMTVVFGYLPAALSVFAIAGVSICIVYHLLGR